MIRINVLTLLFVLMVNTSFSQGSWDAFKGVPFGTSVQDAIQIIQGTFNTNAVEINATIFNQSDVAAFASATSCPPLKTITASEKFGEKSIYYFSNDRLFMVLHQPPYTVSQRPKRVIRNINKEFSPLLEPEKKKDLPFPASWGRYPVPHLEYPLGLEWRTDVILVRLVARTWPVDDMQEIVRGIYLSLEQNKLNVACLQEIARQQEEERLRKETEKQRQQEEAALQNQIRQVQQEAEANEEATRNEQENDIRQSPSL